jgi:hypothetical protein
MRLMTVAPSNPTRRLLVSAVIVLVVALHAVPLLDRGVRKTFWPFLEWSMYNDASPPGPVEAVNREFTGVTRQGREVEVTASLAGLGPPAFTRLYIRPMLKGDSTATRRLLARLNRGRADPFVELRLSGEHYQLTDAGIVAEPLPVTVYREGGEGAP